MSGRVSTLLASLQGGGYIPRMNFPSSLSGGVLLKRYRRFLADIRLENGKTVTAHCPSSGTLRGCADPGSRVLLSDSGNPARRHPLTWELTDVAGSPVCVNTPLCRRLMFEAIEERRIPLFAPFHEAQRDAANAMHGTFDILLHGMEKNGFVNLFSVTWAENGVALFPDAPGGKPVTAIRHLAEIARQGHHAVAFFLVQRGDCRVLRPAETVDRVFMKTMLAAQSAGVEFLAHGTDITPTGIALGPRLSVSLG